MGKTIWRLAWCKWDGELIATYSVEYDSATALPDLFAMMRDRLLSDGVVSSASDLAGVEIDVRPSLFAIVKPRPQPVGHVQIERITHEDEPPRPTLVELKARLARSGADLAAGRTVSLESVLSRGVRSRDDEGSLT